MELLEKAAYIKGMVEGMELDENKKEVKLIKALLDLVKDLSETVVGLREELDEVCELTDILDHDLGDVEEAIFGDDDECDWDECDCDDCDCDCDDEDEEVYEVTCPSCNATLYVDEEMLDEGEMVCPSCHEKLEFDLDIGDCGCDEEDCGCEEEE